MRSSTILIRAPLAPPNSLRGLLAFPLLMLALSLLCLPALAAQPPAHEPIERTDSNSRKGHQELIAKLQQGKIDVYFVGDSITRRWGALDYPDLLKNWNSNFHGWNAANFGWGGDTTHHILWRLRHGELQGIQPKLIVLQAGANNLPLQGPANANHLSDVVQGIHAILHELHTLSPNSHLVLTAMFPRSQNRELKPTILQINQQLADLVDQLASQGLTIQFLNIQDSLTDPSGDLLPNLSTDGLHLEAPAYQLWADALKPIFHDVLGPPASTDEAPPATGDPRKGPYRR